MPVEPNRHRLIRNAAWPKYPENFPAREPIPVEVHIWWAHGWPPEVLPALADRWNDAYVRVMLDPVVHARDVVWLRPVDVPRRVA
ncbi:MAG TPA: hypothetical protein VIM10_04620 [Actinopolymorphaceae bacterium]|jgi:hypothetical protein